MKKLLAIVLLACSMNVSAHGYYGGYRHYSNGGNGWAIAGAVIGGLALGAAITQPYYPAPVYQYVPPYPVYPVYPVRCYFIQQYDAWGRVYQQQVCQ